MGTFSKDKLKSIPKNKKSFGVINLQNSDEGGGSHWVGFYNDPSLKNVLYFDSYGVVPPTETEKALKSTNKNILYNTSQIQNIRSVLCGYYVIFFIDSMINKEDYLDFVNIFDDDGDPKFKNDKKLKEMVDIKTGDGIKDIFNKVKNTVKNAFDALVNGKRKGLSPAFRKTLKELEDKDIIQISIVRKPVQKVLTTIINLITLGKFENQMKSLNYDQVYHLSAILKLSNGKSLFLEKNSVPELKQNTGDVIGDKINVNMRSPINLRKFIEGTYDKIGEENYVNYTAETLNCQAFIISHLETFGLSNKKIEEFIMQDAAQLLSKDPKVYKALKAVTDLGGLADVVIHGRGFTDEFKKFFSDLIELFKPSTKQTNSQADDIRRNKIDKTRNDFGTMAYNLIKKKSI